MPGPWRFGAAAAAAFALGSFVVLVAVASPAGAEVSGPCHASLNGVSVDDGHDRAGSAVEVDYRSTIRAEGSALNGAASAVEYSIRVAGVDVALGEDFVTSSDRWSGQVRVKDYAWASVGLYEVIGKAQTAGGPCVARAYVCVTGKSPFTTAAGLAAGAVGLLGLLGAGRALGRRRALATGRLAGRLGRNGLLVGLGSVVLMQHACVLPLTPLSLSIVPLGAAFLAGAVGIAFGHGIPVPFYPPPAAAPEPDRPDQPRRLYQFVAPFDACRACRQHAGHKVYAHAESMKRAHPGCRCTVNWRPVDEASWQAYFQGGTAYDDRRSYRGIEYGIE